MKLHSFEMKGHKRHRRVLLESWTEYFEEKGARLGDVFPWETGSQGSLAISVCGRSLLSGLTLVFSRL